MPSQTKRYFGHWVPKWLAYKRWRPDIRRWRIDFIRWRTDSLAKRPVFIAVSGHWRCDDHNMSTQHITTLLGAACCVCLATVFRCVATCWVLLAQVWNWSNLSQQHPACRNKVTKRTQHVAANNVAICCVGMLWSFGRGLIDGCDH